MSFSTLRHGDLEDVAAILDSRGLGDSEVAAVLLNLIDNVRRMERARQLEKLNRASSENL